MPPLSLLFARWSPLAAQPAEPSEALVSTTGRPAAGRWPAHRRVISPPLWAAVLVLGLLSALWLRQSAVQRFERAQSLAAQHLAQSLAQQLSAAWAQRAVTAASTATATPIATTTATVIASANAPDLAGLLASSARLAGLSSVSLGDGRGQLLAQVTLATPPTLQHRMVNAPAGLSRWIGLPTAPALASFYIEGQALHLRVRADPAVVLDGPWQGLLAIGLALLALAGLAQALAWRGERQLALAVAQALVDADADESPAVAAHQPAGRGLSQRFVDSQPGGQDDAAWHAASPSEPAAEAAGPPPVSGPVIAALRPLTEGLRALMSRQRKLLDAQAEELEAVRQQAHTDALTGLPNRRHFMATLEAMLADDSAPGAAGLLLLRVQDLGGMNQRIGRSATDHVLQALGETLLSYPSRIAHCCVGRISGADFALLLPAAGMADETARSLLQALSLPLRSIDLTARVVAGAVELRAPGHGPLRAAQALALADAALARREANAGASGVDSVSVPAAAAPPQSGTGLPQNPAEWQHQLSEALAQGRVALAGYPVRTADGRQLHLDCPLRVQLVAGGPLEPASRWLSQAIRCRLGAAVDEKAVSLALSAIARDGVARCINIGAQSVGEPAFVEAITQRLANAPEAASRLWIDLPETLALERPALVRELSRRWRSLGVMLGLEHAGEALPSLPRLIDLGLDCVRIDSRFVNGITGAEADSARRYLKGLVRLVQSVGLQACAEGVRSRDDLEFLWALGFDAATGPALVEALELV